MMPVGLIGTLELLEDFEYIWIPPFHILRGIDFTGPWNYKKGLASFSRLIDMSATVLRMSGYKIYHHVPSKNQLMHDREELEMGLEYWIRPGVSSLRKCINSIEKSAQDFLYFNSLGRCP